MTWPSPFRRCCKFSGESEARTFPSCKIMMRVQVISLFLAGLLGPAGMAADWPQFRGPDGQGHSSARGLPLHWSEKENVRWKTAIPGLGWSVFFAWKVFDSDGFYMRCLNRILLVERDTRR